MDSDRTDYMTQAFIAAQEASAAGEVPVGAVVVERQSGKILSSAGNRTLRDHDPSAHAEVLAIRAACAQQGAARLPECDLYVTLEPCPMCASVISFARIGRLYFGAYDPKSGGVDHGPRIFSHETCHHAPQVFGGIQERECAALLKAFFRNLRG